MLFVLLLLVFLMYNVFCKLMQLITYFFLSFLHGGVSDHGLHLRIMDGGAPTPPPPLLPCCLVPIGPILYTCFGTKK